MNDQGQNRQNAGADDVQRVDGVDVASASQSAVELFRLCLGAQRVLAAVIGARGQA